MKQDLVMLLLLCLTVLAESRYAKVNFNLGLTVADEAPRPLSEDMIRLCGEQTDLALQQQHDLPHPSAPVQCFSHCLYEQMGLRHDGVFVERDFIGLLSDVSNPATWPERQCHAIRGSNKCETALKIHQCRQQIKQQHNLEPSKDVEIPPTSGSSSTPTQEDDFLP